MNKQDFINALWEGLKEIPDIDKKQYIEYYSEMIDDRTEEGISEEEAIKEIGNIDDIIAQIKEETPSKTESKPNNRKLKTWEIILLAVGSPIWVSLIIAAFAVLISLLAAGGAVIISFYAAALAFGVSAVASIPLFIILLTKNNIAGGLLVLGSGFICAGLAIFTFIGTNKLAKLFIKLCEKSFTWLISCFRRKENAK